MITDKWGYKIKKYIQKALNGEAQVYIDKPCV